MDKIMCRSNMIGMERTGNRKWSDRDFMEHQANVYAAALLMPRPSFVPFVMALNKKAGFSDGIFVIRITSIGVGMQTLKISVRRLRKYMVFLILQHTSI